MFAWIRDGAPEGQPCLEAQVMDWADDVAYSVHDLEDGLHAGLVTLRQLRDPGERQAVAELTLTAYCAPGSTTSAELTEIFAGLVSLDCWPAEFDGSPVSVAAVRPGQRADWPPVPGGPAGNPARRPSAGDPL